MKLYEVSNALAEIHDTISQGNLTLDDASDTIDSLLPVAKEPATNIAALVLNDEAEIEALKAAEERIAKRRKRREKAVVTFKQYLLENMEACGIIELSTDEFSVKVVANPERVEIAKDFDIEDLKDKFLRRVTTVQPNKKEIKSALVNGEAVSGSRIVRGRRLRFA